MYLEDLQQQALQKCAESFALYRDISAHNTKKILAAFQRAKLSDFHFHGTSGYGYNDVGREKLDEIYADIFRTEMALVRPHFVSGTHALVTVLLALLESGDEMIAAMGRPYDTMQTAIGLKGNAPGNLQSRGVIYREVETKEGRCDIEQLVALLNEKTKLVLIQRSRGYATREALTIADIENIIRAVKNKYPQIICFVDNCYGEFTECQEPTEVGADIMAGSLIKNPGGGLASTGGYIVGRQELVEKAAHMLTAPGLGNEMGSYAAGYRLFFQGLFMAPHVVSQALQGADFAAAVFSELGFDVHPILGSTRSDLIQSISLRTEENLCAFCEGLQGASPVDGYVRPVPGELPGYADPVIMACGAFVQGSSIELSADAPVRSPYTVYLQGGLIFEHNMIGVMGAAERVWRLIS